MKTCKTCNFLSNIKLGAGRTCLASGRITVEDAPICQDYEKGSNPESFRAAGVLLRAVQRKEVKVG